MRAPVWDQPHSTGVPAAAQPCCLPEHKQNSPRSVSDRRPEDTERRMTSWAKHREGGMGDQVWTLPQSTYVPCTYLGK